MSSGPSDESANIEELLRALAAEYFETHLGVDPPTAHEFASRHPELASRLMPLLEQVDRLFYEALEGPPILELPIVVDDYELTEVLGAGSFATVYLARDLRHDRAVAVKILDRDPGPFGTRDAQFIHDRRVTAAVRHPGIVSLYDSGICGDYRYLVMELGYHGTLRERLESAPDAWEPRSAALFVATLARAVAAAHEVGIIHRDIKPSNVLVDADGHPKLTDFGLALDTRAQTLERYGKSVAGFPPYVAPEIRRHGIGAASVRSDVFSLGVLLHRLVYGALPEETESKPPATMKSRVPYDLRRIVKRAISSESDQRHATANQFANELERYLQWRPLRRETTSPLGRLLLWGRREPFQVALAFMMFLATTLAIMATWNAVLRREEAQIRADLESENANFRERLADETEKAILAEVQARYRAMVPNRREQVRQRLRQMLEFRELMSLEGISQERLVQIRSLYCQTLALPDFVEAFRRPLPAYDFDYWRVTRHPVSGELVVGLHDQVVTLDRAPTELSAFGPQKERVTPKFSRRGRFLSVMLPSGEWELRHGQPPYELLARSAPEALPVIALWISDDEQSLQTIDEQGSVNRFDLTDLEDLRNPALSTSFISISNATAACWSRSGEQLLLGSSDGRIGYWERRAVEWTLRWTQSVSRGAVDSLSMADDGKVAVGTHDGRIHVFDVDGHRLQEFEVSSFGVSSICFSPNSQLLFSGTRNVKGKGWNLETGEEVLQFDGTPIEVSTDGRVLTFGGWNTAGCIDIKAPEGMLKLGDHQAPVCRTNWSSDGTILASLDSDGRIVVRDLLAEKRLAVFDDGPADYYAENTGLALSSDGAFLATVSGGPLSQARIRHVRSGATLLQCRLPDGFERLVPLDGCEFLLVRQERRDHRQVALVSYRLTLRGLEDRRLIREASPGELGFVHAEISRGGEYFAWFGPRYPETNRRWELWDLKRGELLMQQPTATSISTFFSADGRRVHLATHADSFQWHIPRGPMSQPSRLRLLESPEKGWFVSDDVREGISLASLYATGDPYPIATLYHELPGLVATSLSMDPTGTRLAFGRTGDALVVIDVPALEAAIRRDFPEAFRSGH